MGTVEPNNLDPVGFLNINKPKGVTSRSVVDEIQHHLRRQLGFKVKVGHSGTLDPLADGVLVLGIGNATSLLQVLQIGYKRYRATFLLGARSETLDQESQVHSVPVPEDLDEARFRSCMSNFCGTITQVPPKHSAIKVGGQRAYNLVRQGQDFEIPQRRVQVEKLDLVEFNRQHFCIDVQCSGGTYIRTLGRDLAQAAGTDAVMTQLTRTASCGIALDQSATLQDLLHRPIQQADLLEPLGALQGLPCIEIPAEHHRRFADGLITHRIVQNLNQAFPDQLRPTRQQPAVLAHRGKLAGVVYWDPDQVISSSDTPNADGVGRWNTLVNFAKFSYR